MRTGELATLPSLLPSSSGMQCVFTALWIPVSLRKSFFPGLEKTSRLSLLRMPPLPQLELLGSRVGG